MSGNIVCEVCSGKERAPVDRPWEFRLNDFLREGIRQHGVVPLIWALQKKRPMSEQCLIFEGPLDVYIERPSWEGGRPLTDVDLTCVTDGAVRMYEVKQSARQLHGSELRQFGDLMKRLRPDIAVLAVMEPENKTINDSFASFRDQLAGSGIAAELVTLDEAADLEHSMT